MTHSRREVLALLESIGVRPRKALGQNFVVDPNLVRRIARLAELAPDEWVIEIGGGVGSLTLALEEAGARVAVIETDAAMVGILNRVVDPARTRVIHADAMRFDYAALLRELGVEHAPLVANLPYNIATPLIADLLDHVPAIDRMIVMVQREVADRLVARAGTAAYGIPSVKVAYWADRKIVAAVPPDVFFPRPNVDSAVVRIVCREPPVAGVDTAVLFRLVRSGFGQRRKMLRRSLAGHASVEQLAAAGIAPEQRAEEIDVAQWCRLALVVAAARGADAPDGASGDLVSPPTPPQGGDDVCS